MEHLNVCLINDSFPPAIDGVANAVTNYARIISDKYGRATVITPFYPNADDSAFHFPVLRYPSVDLTKYVGYRAGLPFSLNTMRQAEAAGFDIIHSHCPITSTMFARVLRDQIKVPVVLTYHTKFDIDIANAVHNRLMQEEAARLLVENISACDEVWTVSRGAGENLSKLGYSGPYRVMPNGVDFPQGRVEKTLIDQVTEDFDLPEGVPVFLFVGRMMWYKGLRIILDALKELDEAGLEYRMVFVGAGNDKTEVADYTRSLGLEEKVLFSDAIRDRDRIRAWYCRADLFLFPSTFDTNGLVVREAAACGLASILVAGSCAAEDVTDGENGFLIEENSSAMAAKLRELMNNPEIIRRVGECAQNTIYISWESAVKNAYARYGEVIENYRLGRYPEHASLTDKSFSKISELMALRSQQREREEAVRSELRSGYEEIYSSYQELWTDLKGELRKLEEQQEKIYRYMDRFL